MDHHGFDNLTRTLAARLGRRAGLRAIAGLAAVGAGASITGHAAAGGGPPLDPFCRAGRQTCTRNQQCCSGTCNVGRGVPIQHRNRCVCEGGLTVCGSRCVSTASNRDHCGACGRRCSTGEACIAGECQAPTPCSSSRARICFVETNRAMHEIDHICLAPFPTSGEPCSSNADCETAFLELEDPVEYQTLHVACAASGGGSENRSEWNHVCIAWVDEVECVPV